MEVAANAFELNELIVDNVAEEEFAEATLGFTAHIPSNNVRKAEAKNRFFILLYNKLIICHILVLPLVRH